MRAHLALCTDPETCHSVQQLARGLSLTVITYSGANRTYRDLRSAPRPTFFPFQEAETPLLTQ
jgi:hypothetical protein